MLSTDVDLAQVLLACIQGRLHETIFSSSVDLYCCGVIVAAEGYPAKPCEGDIIKIGDLPEGKSDLHYFNKSPTDRVE